MNKADMEQLKKMATLNTSSFLAPFIDDRGNIDWISLVADRNMKIKALELELKESKEINKTFAKTIASQNHRLKNLEKLLEKLPWEEQYL